MDDYTVDRFEFFNGGGYELEDDVYPSIMIDLFNEETVADSLEELIALFIHFESIEEVHSSEILLLSSLIKAIKEHDVDTLDGIVESGRQIELSDYLVYLNFNDEAYARELEKSWI